METMLKVAQVAFVVLFLGASPRADGIMTRQLPPFKEYCFKINYNKTQVEIATTEMLREEVFRAAKEGGLPASVLEKELADIKFFEREGGNVVVCLYYQRN